MNFKDLNPDLDNCNFNIDVLEKVFLEKLKEPFSQAQLFIVLSGAKGFGKSYLICLLALFFTCNFLDYNALLTKYTFTAARESYVKMMNRVINDLEKFGVTIRQDIDNKIIKIHDSENRCDWIWPNKRVIKIAGFDNTSKWEGVAAEVGEFAMFAIDEVIPLNGGIVDEQDYTYQLFNIFTQIVRGKNLTILKEHLPELTCNNLALQKKQMIIFGFNNHDTDHPIYQLFVQQIIPLTPKRKKELEENYVSWDVHPSYLRLGAMVIRGSTKINENNLNSELDELGEGIKEQYPEIHETLFLGGESQMQIDHYSYRKDLIQNAKFFDKQEYFWKDTKRFYFDEITIGCDYADGGAMGDDAVTIIVGFEVDQENYVTGVYILDEQSISTRTFKDMTKKVEFIAQDISMWSTMYEQGQDRIEIRQDLKFRIGQDSKTVKDFIKKTLVEQHDFNQDDLDKTFSIFISSGQKGWDVNSRHYFWKRLLANGKLHFANDLAVTKEINGTNVVIKEHGHLYHELYNCKNDPDTNIRNEKKHQNKLDAINAAEHAISYKRFRLFH